MTTTPAHKPARSPAHSRCRDRIDDRRAGRGVRQLRLPRLLRRRPESTWWAIFAAPRAIAAIVAYVMSGFVASKVMRTGLGWLAC